MDQLYPMVCVTAALASFLGCGYSVLRGKGTSMLTVPVVVAVFLTLTLAAAFFTADAVRIENGLTGLGLSMAAGGGPARHQHMRRGQGLESPPSYVDRGDCDFDAAPINIVQNFHFRKGKTAALPFFVIYAKFLCQ